MREIANKVLRSKIKNRRKFLRVKKHNLIKYKIISGTGEALSFSRNMSAGGILFYAKEDIPLGSTVAVKINFPSYPEPIKVISRTLRSKPFKTIEGFEVAAEFINIEEKSRAFIDKKLRKQHE